MDGPGGTARPDLRICSGSRMPTSVGTISACPRVGSHDPARPSNYWSATHARGLELSHHQVPSVDLRAAGAFVAAGLVPGLPASA